MSGGYEDDEDDGETFTYTGAGGRDLSGNKRTADQAFDQELKAVRTPFPPSTSLTPSSLHSSLFTPHSAHLPLHLSTSSPATPPSPFASLSLHLHPLFLCSFTFLAADLNLVEFGSCKKLHEFHG